MRPTNTAPGGPHPRHVRRVDDADAGREHRRARRERLPGRLGEVLDRLRDAVQHAAVLPAAQLGVPLRGLGEHGLGVGPGDERGHGGVHRVGVREVVAGHLHARHLTGGDRRREPHETELADRGDGHRSRRSRPAQRGFTSPISPQPFPSTPCTLMMRGVVST